MTSLSKELIFLILDFLERDKNFHETARKLEQESRVYFNMKYFAGVIMEGHLDEAERYFASFTNISDNCHSRETFFEIRKHKYLDALDKQEWTKARMILHDELSFIAPYDQTLYDETAQLLIVKNFKEHKHLRGYENTEAMRAKLLEKLKNYIEENPIFSNILEFPKNLDKSRLITLMNQSLKWQHANRGSPKPVKPSLADIRTLLVEHAMISIALDPDESVQTVPEHYDPTIPLANFLAYSAFSEPEPEHETDERAKTEEDSNEEVPEIGPSNSDQQPESPQN